MQRGARRTLLAQGDTYVYARGAGPDLAIVALNRGNAAQTVHVVIPAELGPQGAVLKDALSGASKDVSGGSLDLTMAPRSAAVLLR